MTNPLSNEDIHEIVQRIVGKTMDNQAASEYKETIGEKPETLAEETKPLVVAIGTDHGGVDLKEILKKDLVEKRYEVIDVGTHTKDSVDYPDIALSVARLVAQGKAWRGVVIDGAGIGSCMAANKVPGVRAAMCYDYATAVNSREHNNANVLTLGAGLIGI
ncbi:MAG TPA: RpiB/LacA/LacB family sugar-phosphate isomerase, partial [Brevefilum sp.]